MALSLRTYFWWLIVFLRRHRVRPTVAMAWVIEIIIIVLEGRTFPEQKGLEQLKILSLALTAYNGLFTFCDWIEYSRSHPHLAAFHLTLFVFAMLHLTASLLVIFLRHQLERLVSPVGFTVATLELYGADAYFAAQEAYNDTHPQLTRLTPSLSCFTQLCTQVRPRTEPSGPSIAVNSSSSSSPIHGGPELEPGIGHRPKDTQIQSCSRDVEAQLERDEQTSEEYHATTSEFDGQD